MKQALYRLELQGKTRSAWMCGWHSSEKRSRQRSQFPEGVTSKLKRSHYRDWSYLSRKYAIIRCF